MNTLDWHRREDKAVWWEHSRLADLSAEDLSEEHAALSGLAFQEAVGGTARGPIHRYRFPPQETEIRGGAGLRSLGGQRFGKVEAVSLDAGTVDTKKRQDTATTHPAGVFGHTHVPKKVLADALVRIGECVAEHGIQGGGPYRAARDLLLRQIARLNGGPIRNQGETTLDATLRLTEHLGEGIFPIQGPPGAGKNYTAARMICALVDHGKRVGITANSHTVIRNVIDKTIETAEELGIDLKCCQKTADAEPGNDRLSLTNDNGAILGALGNSVQVGGGTAWLWAREDAPNAVDVLIIDDAAQMSLADVLAVSQAAPHVYPDRRSKAARPADAGLSPGRDGRLGA